jgi:DNA sulfur modification protein DndC
MDDRFYVYMLGYGVPPPSNTFRWCTDKLKIAPMARAMAEKRERTGEKFLLINGVRLGESDARDQRIAVSCSKDSGECGQGWFEVKPPADAGDSLAPLLHWRICHVYDWLYFNDHRHGYPEVVGIADVYGEGDVRTGCIGCNLASRDVALERLISLPQYGHLSPLLELRDVFKELKRPRRRLRKAEPERRKDGQWSKNGQRMGPLTMQARAWGLAKVLDIQARAGVDLINAAEEARIREMWALNMWPQKWTGEEVRADVPIDKIFVADGGLIRQPLLVR